MPDFDDFGYGAAEDQAATDAILSADDEFNVEPIEPEAHAEPIAEEEEVMEVDAIEVVEVMEVDDVDAAGNVYGHNIGHVQLNHIY
uniref:EFTUD2 domain-containing protein n=1 Tax=Panagrellus redivivus TaxID=6233 RepID=A0A7E4VVH7_PANRE